MSVATATQRSTAAQGDTRRDKNETARIAENSQLAGRFPRVWQVLGSNQRRLSRRFYSPSLLAEAHAADQHIRRSRRRPGPPPSAYLHRRDVCKWLRDGPFTVLGRASLCSLALIAAGCCERPAESGGAKRPRSGAAGALDAAGREQIMAGEARERTTVVGGFRGWFRPFSSGTGVTCSWRDGDGEGQPGLPRPAGAAPRPGHDDRLGCPPACGGMRPLSLYRPSAWPCAAGPGAADSGLAGAGRGYAPSGEFGCGSPAWPTASRWATIGDGMSGLRRR